MNDDEDNFKTLDQLLAEAAISFGGRAPSPLPAPTPAELDRRRQSAKPSYDPIPFRKIVEDAKADLARAAELSRQRAAAFNDPFADVDAKDKGVGTTPTVTPAVTPPPSKPRNAPRYKPCRKRI